MKKILLTLTILVTMITQGFSTHLMGGEILAQHAGGNNYDILLTIYRDTIGVDADSVQMFNILDAAGNTIATIVSTYNPTAFHPIFGLPQGGLLPLTPYGIEVYFYSATITLPGAGEYTITWDNCCRNAAIQNLPTPLNNSMQLFTTITNDTNVSNSTPYFMVRPVIHLPVNTPWQYNPLPFDPDGDSLSWHLGNPNDVGGIPIPGYTYPASDPSGPISIDSITGTISWTASTLGNWVYTVVCEEFRNGVKIGEIRRDMQFVVMPAGSMPGFSNIGTIPIQNGYPTWSINSGQNSELRLMATDNNSSNTITFEAYGESFLLASNPAIYTTETMSGTNDIEAVINWTPTSNEVRSAPYLMVLRLMNGTFTFDETILVKVQSSGTSIKDNNINTIGEIYPNPTNSLLNIPLTLNKNGAVTIRIFNNYGQIIKEETSNFSIGNINALMQIDLVPAGQYYVTIHQNNKPLGVKTLSIVR